MIVSCPSCGTRYSQRVEELQAASARCSHCESTVPIVAAKRPYVLIPSAGGSIAMRIGMDDPRLAEKLTRAAHDGEGVKPAGALTSREASAERAPWGMARSHADRFGKANGAAPAIFKRREQSERAAMQSKSPAEAPERDRRIGQEAVVAVVLSIIGGAAAYYSAVEQGLDTPTWVMAGAGLGLFMAWICARWTRRH